MQAGVPFGLGAYEGSITFEQELPLSSIRGNRRRAAEADADRWGADTRRAALDVEYQALDSFYMLAERRGTAPILDEQIAITDQLTSRGPGCGASAASSDARCSAACGPNEATVRAAISGWQEGDRLATRRRERRSPRHASCPRRRARTPHR